MPLTVPPLRIRLHATDRKMRVPTDISLPNVEVATHNVPKGGLQLKQGMRLTCNVRWKRHYDKHGQPNVHQHET